LLTAASSRPKRSKQRLGSESAQLGGESVAGLLVAAGDDETGAFARERERGRAADAGEGAGDEDDGGGGRGSGHGGFLKEVKGVENAVQYVRTY
jgi:hypothetical protein